MPSYNLPWDKQRTITRTTQSNHIDFDLLFEENKRNGEGKYQDRQNIPSKKSDTFCEISDNSRNRHKILGERCDISYQNKMLSDNKHVVDRHRQIFKNERKSIPRESHIISDERQKMPDESNTKELIEDKRQTGKSPHISKPSGETAENKWREIEDVRCPSFRPLAGRHEPLSQSDRLSLGLDCDEVISGVVLASGKTVKNITYMRELGVTHMINTASRDVWLPEEKLTNLGVKLLQFHVDDVSSANIKPYFQSAADMMSQSMKEGGMLVVNCLVGLSRSATVLTAGLMIINSWTVVRSLRMLRLKRPIKPNKGFILQLLRLELELRQQGLELK